MVEKKSKKDCFYAVEGRNEGLGESFIFNPVSPGTILYLFIFSSILSFLFF